MSETKSLPSILKCVTPTCVCECVIKCFRLRCVCVCLRCSWFRMKDTQKQVIFIKGVGLLLSVWPRAFVTHRAGTTRTIFHYTLTSPRPSRLHTEGHPICFCRLHKSPPRLSLSKQDKSPANRPRRKGTPGRRVSRGSHPTFKSTSTKKKQVPITQKKQKGFNWDIISPSCTYRTRPDLDLLTSENLQEKSQGSQMCHNSRKEALSSVNTLNTLIFSKTNICSGDLLTTSTHIGRQMDFLWGRFVLKALK